MDERTDKVLSKSDKERAMSDTAFAHSDPAFARNLMREAFPKDRHGSVYEAQYAAFDYLRRVVKKQMTFRRARSIWERCCKAYRRRRSLRIEAGKNRGSPP